jgi:hypothetical protein
MAHDLTERQRQILHTGASGRDRQIAKIRAQIDPSAADRTLRDDLPHLKRRGLIESPGALIIVFHLVWFSSYHGESQDGPSRWHSEAFSRMPDSPPSIGTI